MPKLTLLAPLSGEVWPLERIPDPVFAQKMVGDGLSIDPTDSVLLAPCDGEVIMLHAAGHAVDPGHVVARAAVPEAEWRDAWKRYFRTIRLTRQIVVVPSWDTFAATKSIALAFLQAATHAPH